ncbi:MAG: flgI [Chlamydiales bacterium]|nr:flgI [Chlamydiales bacterium]
MKRLRTFFLGSLTLFSLPLLGNVSRGAIQNPLLHMDSGWNSDMSPYRGIEAPGRSIKIRDLVDIQGEEVVKLQGFGVVTGLQGTGDSGDAAIKMIVSVAERQGIRLNSSDIKNKNVALVSLSAEVNPYQRSFDLAVKSIGDAKSLQNGYLEASTLSPIGSNEIYAVASGAVALGARYFEASGQNNRGGGGGGASGSSSITIGHPTMGFVMNGGQLVKEILAERQQDSTITLLLKHPSDRTATNIADAINRTLGKYGVEAEPTNAALISVHLTRHDFLRPGNLTRLIADIGDLSASSSNRAVITIDQGSGVVVMTEGVKMEPGSIAIAGLTVTVSSHITPVTRQGMFNGDTSFVDAPELQVSQDQANFLTVPAGTDLRKVQETLNALKLTPTSLISLFNAMQKAGMIHADIVIIPR